MNSGWPIFIAERCMPGPEALENYQKRLFKTIQSEISLYKLKDRKEIGAYQRRFEQNFKGKFSATNKKALIERSLHAKVVLVGDFHPFNQSQKGFLRLIKERIKTNRNIMIGLECIQQSKQLAIQQYFSDLITINELREEVEFESYWPFHWENYREIIELAKEWKVPLFGMNIPEKKRTIDSLNQRDQAAAERISALIQENENHTIFVLYGELHLATSHLPKKIKDIAPHLKPFLIHQNIPKLYWQAPILKNGLRPEVLKLSRDEYCVLNSVPWLKLKSYLDWIEGDQFEEEEIDITEEVSSYANILSDVIGKVTPLSPTLQIMPLQHFSSRNKLGRSAELRHARQFQRTLFLPQFESILIAPASNNAILEAASYAIWHSKSQSKQAERNEHDRVLKYFIGYLGSKILNPKRKCNEVQDIRLFLLNEKSKSSKAKEKKAIFQQALLKLSHYLPRGRKQKKITRLTNIQNMEAARVAGYLLADRFFLALSKDKKLFEIVPKLYSVSFTQKQASLTLLKKIGKLIVKIEPINKNDRL